ncbi:zinc ABC transporter substrate-binding protein [Pseudorhodobacter ferrugineus]|uniref:zinc ABC transporter substrate-binding protein n=1 Tax=Pseudorhodobacter ferrugineus TaxID=77008 RepID=UPI0003B5D54E|nr:zinc ABC transporter substrate-binding protein [Pseudorhodobacter ferrugineus]
MRTLITCAAAVLIGQSALADAPKVVTDFGPVHSLVSMVMGDLGAPEVLLPMGGNAHDFQLRPSQAQSLAAADLIIWVGPEMTPWLGRAMDGLGKGEGLALLDAPGTLTRSFAETAEMAEGDADEHKGHDHADEAKDEHAEEHEHSHDGVDPHAWLNPQNAQIWLGLIAEALAAADPAQAAVYRANAVAAQAKVDGIEAEARAMLAPVEGKAFATNHAAYGYFVDHFGLKFAGSLRESDAAASGAAHIAALQKTLQEDGVVCLFPEANHSAESVAQMAEATGVRIGAPLDPEGTAIAPGADLYGALLLGLAKSLADCMVAQ